jgi:hypothetical protein
MAPYCPPSSGVGGGVVAGNDIYDAISGAPGTYVTIDSQGNVGFGFSSTLWAQTENLIDGTVSAATNNPKFGVDPDEVPTTSGYEVVQQDFGPAGSTISGVVPDVVNLISQQQQFAAMLPSGFQSFYQSWVGMEGPFVALSRTMTKMAFQAAQAEAQAKATNQPPDPIVGIYNQLNAIYQSYQQFGGQVNNEFCELMGCGYY